MFEKFPLNKQKMWKEICKFFWFSGFANSLLKYKNFLSLRLESSISQNTRNFFRVGFFLIFRARKVFYWNIKKNFKKFHFPKYKKSFFWENIRTFLILGLESSTSRNIRKTFFWESKINFLIVNCFMKKYKKFFQIKRLSERCAS